MTAEKPIDVTESESSSRKSISEALTPKSDVEIAGAVPKDAPVGSISDIKSLYQGPTDSEGRAQWLDRYPEDLAEAAENEETERYALIARKKKCFDGRKKFDVDSIIVQSPALKEILGRVFDGYPGISCELNRLVFSAPFNAFVHRWAEFTRELEEVKPGKAKEHLEILHSLLKDELKDTIKALEDYVVHGIVTYEHLWVIFQPGTFVYTKEGGSPRAMQFDKGQYMKTRCGPCYHLSLHSVGWSGTSFGRSDESIQIYSWTGTRPIKDLHALPLSLHPEQQSIKLSLVERGKKYESLAGYHFKSYNGVALTWDLKDNITPLTVTGRIVIDTDVFDTFNPDRAEAFADLRDSDYTLLSKISMNDEAPNRYTGGDAPPKVSLTGDAHVICRPTLQGYSLKLKKWMYFFIENVGEIEWNSNAFDTLVLPMDTKDMLRGFVKSQVQNQSTFDDVIEGKGKGIIMLLSGPPGVGKTLTAESVAESMHIPLYTMSAGDLGTNSSDVESSLQDILEMATKWKAVLLLDECDVFLEARTLHDLKRNRLVSVFLRMLEYYEGILFMTTNRVSNMDAAFQSRIHVSLAYPDLTSESRRQIWSNFLDLSSQKSEIRKGDLDMLADVVLNGRQIKNILKISFLVASRKGVPLKKEHIDTVLAIEGRRPDTAQGGL